MLLAHPWVKPLQLPETIAEDVEAEDAAADDELADATGLLNLNGAAGMSGGADPEVAQWVNEVLERKRKGLLAGEASKPALHKADLNRIISPAGSPMIPA